MPLRPVVKCRRSLWDARKTKVDRKCRQWPYVFTHGGFEVLPALAQDSFSQAEISLYSVTENLMDRPTIPDKSGQEMHANPTGFPLASTYPPRVCNGAVGVSAPLPLRVTRLQHQFSQYKLLSVAFLKQFRCHKQQLKTGTRLRRQTRMTDNKFKNSNFFKFHPIFATPPDCRQGRSAPAAPPSLRYCRSVNCIQCL